MARLLLIILVLLGNFGDFPQTTPAPTITLEYMALGASARTYAAEVFTALASHLPDYPLEIRPASNDSSGDALLTMQFIPTISTDAAINTAVILQQHRSLREVSPMLMHAPDTSPIITQQTADGIAQLVAALITYVRGDCERANYLFQDTEPQRIAHFYIGNCALLDGNLTDAINLYRSRIDNDHSQLMAATRTNLAWAYFQNGETTSAFDLLDEALSDYAETADTSGLVQIYSARAQLHALNFDYDAAIHDIDIAVNLAPEAPSLYVLRGQIVFLLYEWERVVDNYSQAIMIDSTYAEAYYFRGVAYYSIMPTGLAREEALKDFETYLILDGEGYYSEEAQSYISSIRQELEALSN